MQVWHFRVNLSPKSPPLQEPANNCHTLGQALATKVSHRFHGWHPRRQHPGAATLFRSRRRDNNGWLLQLQARVRATCYIQGYYWRQFSVLSKRSTDCCWATPFSHSISLANSDQWIICVVLFITTGRRELKLAYLIIWQKYDKSNRWVDGVKWRHSNLWSRYDLHVVGHDVVLSEVNWWKFVTLFSYQ